MAKTKKKNWKIKSFSISEDQINMLTEHVRRSPFRKESEFLGWLIEYYDACSDPYKELKLLEEEENRLNSEYDEIKEKRKVVLKKIELYNDKIKSKEVSIKNTIEILKKKYYEGEQQPEIERLARVNGMKIGIDPFELLYRLSREIKMEKQNEL